MSTKKHFRHRAVVAIGAAAMALTLAGPVGSAAANITNPATSYAYAGEAGGKCTVHVGSVWQSTGWAMGGVDVNCDRAMETISAKVTLFRWDGTQWQSITSTAWSPLPWLQNYSLHTPSPGVCGGGNTYWLTRASLFIRRPDGSVYTPVRDSPVYQYAPAHC
jgi:hypothetical protein